MGKGTCIVDFMVAGVNYLGNGFAADLTVRMCSKLKDAATIILFMSSHACD